MTEQSSIPGIHESGMFFEYYVFEPRTNFKEEDIHHVLQFFDITFEDEQRIPKTAKKHFDGLIFKPKDDITVNQFADILQAMRITLGEPAILLKIPAKLRDHFNDELVFDPFDDFSLADLNQFLCGFIHFRINTEQFNKLPHKVKRQFIVFTRDGKNWRYGERRPS